MLVRTETPDDWPAIRAVQESAFGTPAEADLVDAVRSQARPLISLVACSGETIVGHILFSPATLSNHPEIRIMGLAPMGVLPSHQRQGVGSRLVQAGLKECGSLGAAAVVVLGHPDYYPRFGFSRADAFGIGCEYDAPPEAFMLLELRPGALAGASGVIQYHPAFREL